MACLRVLAVDIHLLISFRNGVWTLGLLNRSLKLDSDKIVSLLQAYAKEIV